MKPKPTVLQAVGLCIGYGARRIGGPLNFSLQAGRISCVLGPNGSGKSTLFKSLLALLPPLDGQVFLLNQPLEQWRRRTLAQTIAYVPQNPPALFAFKVIDMVLLGRTAHMGLFAAPAPKDLQIAYQCLEQLGVVHLAQRPYTELSGGEQQLVIVARALAQQPRLLILDEPTASLDFGNQLRVLQHIQQLKAQGLAILWCTHQPEHALAIADDLLLFKQGQLLQQGPSKQVLSVSALAQLYDLNTTQVENYRRLWSRL